MYAAVLGRGASRFVRPTAHVRQPRLGASHVHRRHSARSRHGVHRSSVRPGWTGRAQLLGVLCHLLSAHGLRACRRHSVLVQLRQRGADASHRFRQKDQEQSERKQPVRPLQARRGGLGRRDRRLVTIGFCSAAQSATKTTTATTTTTTTTACKCYSILFRKNCLSFESLSAMNE